MEPAQFVQIVASFADSDLGYVDYNKGKLTAIVHNEIFEVTFVKRQFGELYCIENDEEIPAGQWIIKRLGRFDTLARRILEYYQEDDKLIPVKGDLINVIEDSPNLDPKPTSDALTSLGEFINNLRGGITNVVYLTSDAGEGKSCLIEALARRQAQAFLNRKTDWLLLPVALGGQPILRLDDLVIGSVVNRLRFPYYYYDSIIELMKMGCLVLALDGFEEMLIGTQAGDAVSSLSRLVSKLESGGKILIAARKAYYHYKDPNAQTKLHQSFRDLNVTFSEMTLERWTHDQFLYFCITIGIDEYDAKGLYKAIETKFDARHPLLTRAVLARRLIQTYQTAPDRPTLIQQLMRSTSEQYFDDFVRTLIAREVTEKWVNHEVSPAQPLLTIDEHYLLLMEIAEEMWRSGTETIRTDVLEHWTELVVADQLGRPASIVRQAKERIKTHALLKKIEGTILYQFDHEEFRNFYLGRKIASLLCGKRDLQEIRSLLEIGLLPSVAVEVIVAKAIVDFTTSCQITEDLCVIAQASTRTSYIRDNAGQIVIGLLSACGFDRKMRVHHLSFGNDSLKGKHLSGIVFEDCVFDRTSLLDSELKQISFQQCEIACLELPKHSANHDIQMDEASRPYSLLVIEDGDEEDERSYYDPYLRTASASFTCPNIDSTASASFI